VPHAELVKDPLWDKTRDTTTNSANKLIHAGTASHCNYDKSGSVHTAAESISSYRKSQSLRLKNQLLNQDISLSDSIFNI
jgi:hypothetical protein